MLKCEVKKGLSKTGKEYYTLDVVLVTESGKEIVLNRKFLTSMEVEVLRYNNAINE